MGYPFRQLCAVVEISFLRDLAADEPALHLHVRLPAGAGAVLSARRIPCPAGLVRPGRTGAGVEQAVLHLRTRRGACRRASTKISKTTPCKVKCPAEVGSRVLIIQVSGYPSSITASPQRQRRAAA